MKYTITINAEVEAKSADDAVRIFCPNGTSPDSITSVESLFDYVRDLSGRATVSSSEDWIDSRFCEIE